MTAGDVESQFALHLAYLSGVGQLPYLEQRRRAFDHLLLAAQESLDPRLLLSVAHHYRDGLNCVEQDLEQAETWFARAAATNYPEAIKEQRKFLRGRN